MKQRDLPGERQLWLSHNLYPSPHRQWSRGCLWKECVRMLYAYCYLSSIWTRPEYCAVAGKTKQNKKQTDIFSKKKIPMWYYAKMAEVVHLTSSAMNRSFCRKFWASLSLSRTVFFFTCERVVLACWAMLSYNQHNRTPSANYVSAFINSTWRVSIA